MVSVCHVSVSSSLATTYRWFYVRRVCVSSSLTTTYRWFLFAVSPCLQRLLQPSIGFCSQCLCVLIACYNLQVVSVHGVSVSSLLAAAYRWFLFAVSPCLHRLLQPISGFCLPCLHVLIACYNLQVVSVRRLSVSSSHATVYWWFLFAVSSCPHRSLQPTGGFCLPCLHVLIARYNLQVVSVQCVCPHHFPQPTSGFCSLCLHHSNHISALRLVCILSVLFPSQSGKYDIRFFGSLSAGKANCNTVLAATYPASLIPKEPLRYACQKALETHPSQSAAIY